MRINTLLLELTPHAYLMQVLVHNSRQLQGSATLAEAALYDGATLSVCSRLRGGGGDGGSTGAESRSCYLEMYAQRKPDKVGAGVLCCRNWITNSWHAIILHCFCMCSATNSSATAVAAHALRRDAYLLHATPFCGGCQVSVHQRCMPWLADVAEELQACSTDV
jgi:hypothetical protein